MNGGERESTSPEEERSELERGRKRRKKKTKVKKKWGGDGYMLRKEEGCVWLGEIRMVFDNL